MPLFALEKVQQLRTFLEGTAVTDTELYQLLRANGDDVARAANAFLDCAIPCKKLIQINRARNTVYRACENGAFTCSLHTLKSKETRLFMPFIGKKSPVAHVGGGQCPLHPTLYCCLNRQQ